MDQGINPLQHHGASQPLLMPDSLDMNITLAARYGDTGMVGKLLQDAIASDPAALSSHMAGLALKRAIENGHVAVVGLLIEAGLDVNIKYKGATALHEAVKADRWEVLDYLLGISGLQLSAVNAAGKTPAMEAANRGRVKCLSALLAAGCSTEDRNLQGRSAIHFCILSSLPAVDTDDMLACLNLLKQAGADVNAQDLYGKTPLHLAVAEDNVEAVVWLLQNDCSVDVEATFVDLAPGNLSALGRRSMSFTPLLLAIHFSSRRLVQLLINCGALCHHLQWTLPYCEHQKFLHGFLTDCFAVPPSLQQLCRQVVRRTLKLGVARKVAELTNLPGSMRQYILLVDELEQA